MRVDFEGVGDAGLRDFDRLAVVGREGAVLEGGAEEVDDGEREPFLGFGGL